MNTAWISARQSTLYANPPHWQRLNVQGVLCRFAAVTPHGSSAILTTGKDARSQSAPYTSYVVLQEGQGRDERIYAALVRGIDDTATPERDRRLYYGARYALRGVPNPVWHTSPFVALEWLARIAHQPNQPVFAPLVEDPTSLDIALVQIQCSTRIVSIGCVGSGRVYVGAAGESFQNMCRSGGQLDAYTLPFTEGATVALALEPSMPMLQRLAATGSAYTIADRFQEAWAPWNKQYVEEVMPYSNRRKQTPQGSVNRYGEIFKSADPLERTVVGRIRPGGAADGVPLVLSQPRRLKSGYDVDMDGNMRWPRDANTIPTSIHPSSAAAIFLQLS